MRQIKNKELKEVEVPMSTLVKLEKKGAYIKNNKTKDKRNKKKQF